MTSPPDRRQRKVVNLVMIPVLIRLEVIPILSTLYCFAIPVIVSIIIRLPRTQRDSCGILRYIRMLVTAIYQNVFIEAIDIHSENIKIISNRINQKHGHLTISRILIACSYSQQVGLSLVSDHILFLRTSCDRKCNRVVHRQDIQ